MDKMAPGKTGNSAPEQTGRRRRWLWICVSLALLAMVIVLLFEAEDTVDVTQADTPPPAPLVTVLKVMPADVMATVTAFAELRPRWDAEIRSAVSGRITDVHKAALAGERVKVGAPLFSIERSQYQAAVAAAELNLEEARLALWRAENGVTLARRQFERDGVSPPNDLALKLPQLGIAERTVASAQAQLDAARHQLVNTTVKAPFSGYVTKRMASLGQTVAVGEPLLHLSDDQLLELVAELSRADWALLAHPIAGADARLLDRDGATLGKARIRSGGGFLDQATRQRRIFLEVKDPADDLLAGDFVQVEFTGRRLENTLTVPEGALTRAGHIWMVDVDNHLIRIEPEILFRADGLITIATPKGEGPMRVAKTPLASFLPGQLVRPQDMLD